MKARSADGETAANSQREPALDNVEKIAVLGPGAVGDFIFTLPALHALKHTYPDAELVYLGKPWHESFLKHRPGPVDRVLALPPVPGVGHAADTHADAQAGSSFVDSFIENICQEKFDIALQMFGGGRYSNPFLMRFRARLSVGARAADAAALDRWVAHAVPGNRRLALLEIAALAGANGPLPGRELNVTDADREEAARALPCLSSHLQMSRQGASCLSSKCPSQLPAQSTSLSPSQLTSPSPSYSHSRPPSPSPSHSHSQPDSLSPSPSHSPSKAPSPSQSSSRSPSQSCGPPSWEQALVVLQPGSTDSRRCWGPERFAAVADVLAASGALIAINGTAQEAERVARVRAAMRHPSVDLSGALSLGGLCGLIERAALVVSNDTGPMHLALAIGTPCVGIFWHTNFADSMPLRPSLLRAAVSSRQHCPVCGADNHLMRCQHEESFVDDVPVEEVAMMALSMLYRPR